NKFWLFTLSLLPRELATRTCKTYLAQKGAVVHRFTPPQALRVRDSINPDRSALNHTPGGAVPDAEENRSPAAASPGTLLSAAGAFSECYKAAKPGDPPAAREPSCLLVKLHGGGDVLEGRGCDQTIGDASGMVHLLEGDGVAE